MTAARPFPARRGPGVTRAPSDAPALRVAAGIRLAVLVGIAATGSFLPGMTGRRAALLLLLGLVWVPWATALLFASEGQASRWVAVGGPLGDVLLLAVTQWAVPSADAGILLGYLVVVAFTLYTAGPRIAAVAGSGAIAGVVVSQDLAPPADRPGLGQLVPFIVAVVALISVLERTLVLQTRASRRYQRLESKADTILTHVADSVIVTDERGVIVQCNPAAQRMLGRPGVDLTGATCAETLGLHHGERALDCGIGCVLLQLEDHLDAAPGTEVWRIDAAGHRQPLLADASLVASETGGGEVVHSIRDVTRLKQAEEAKTLFLATATHELKTPLTVIRGFAEALTRYEDLDPQRQASALDAIRERAVELTRIVDRLLLSSRIEAGQLELALEEVDVGAVVAERAATFARATGREVTYRVAPGLLPATGRKDALETVVDHLVDNAAKYSPGGGQVTVVADATPAGPCIVVSDEGIGMDPDQAAHCFDKFWQAESTDVRRFGGTGIGLYIVRSLVEAMGGSVGVTSRKGEGSTFTVCLRSALAPGGPPVGVGERTSIREFMRQIGIPERQS